MAVKKAFQPIVNLLESNKESSVSEIIDQVIELASTKGRSGGANTVHRDENGNVVAIFCYYFKKWMPLSHIEFGKKESSASGYNNMCKEGVSNWTKQNREFKAGQQALLDLVIDGEASQEEAKARNEELVENKARVLPHSTGIGFDTVEELLEFDTDLLDQMVLEAEEAAQAEADAGDDEETTEE